MDWSNRHYVWTKWIAAAAAGIAWALAFPRANLAVLAWLIPGILARLAANQRWKTALGLGFAAGLTHSLTSLSWLLFMPFPFGAITGWIALSCYLALYPAVWCLACSRLHVSAPKRWRALTRSILIGLCAAAFWVALEMARGRFLTGFPWNFLGVSQFECLPLIQIASVTGVHGISFLVAWFSISLMQAVESIRRRPASRWGWIANLALPGLVIFGVCLWGGSRALSPGLPAGSIKVALVQPSIPQTLIWDSAANEERFQKMLSLSREALRENPHLLVWPEAAMPTYLRYDWEGFQSITNLIAGKGAWMILGAEDAEPNLSTPDPEDFWFYNSCFLLSPDGDIESGYRKRRLVIFGEYIPLKKWLPFLRHFTPVQNGFQSGDKPAAFELDEWGATAAPLICFEDVFASVARKSVQPDTDFLINLTNNGWFGESAAQWQHAVNAAFRAVECGLPLVRCTNNGLTCWIDAHGRMRDVYFDDSRNIYQEGVKFSEIPLRDNSGEPRTFYLRHGDWFGWICVALSMAQVCALSWRWRTEKGKDRSRRETAPAQHP